jgi:hypothetical protein
LGFSVSGAYGNFQSFMVDLAKSLRVVDALSVSFAATETNLYNYAVEIKTHWLK